MRPVPVLLAVALIAGELPSRAAGLPNTAQNCAIAAGGSVRENTLNCGYTAADVERLIASARVEDQKQIAAQNETIRELSGDIGLTEGAVRAVLSSLGKDQGTIPHERLADALFAEVGQIVAMRQGLTRPSNDAPEIAALKRRAVTEARRQPRPGPSQAGGRPAAGQADRGCRGRPGPTGRYRRRS
jgi:hypothetical protein